MTFLLDATAYRRFWALLRLDSDSAKLRRISALKVYQRPLHTVAGTYIWTRTATWR